MIRTVLAVIILFGVALFLPFWLQVLLYVLAVVLVKHRSLLLLPALFSDAWYAPVRDLSIVHNKTFLVVLGMIFVYLLIMRTTRFSHRYGLPKT